MADLAGGVVDGGPADFKAGTRSNDRSGSTFEGNTPETRLYLMTAKDQDCSNTIRSWLVINDPDMDASEYDGSKCGASPLTHISFTRIR